MLIPAGLGLASTCDVLLKPVKPPRSKCSVASQGTVRGSPQSQSGIIISVSHEGLLLAPVILCAGNLRIIAWILLDTGLWTGLSYPGETSSSSLSSSRRVARSSRVVPYHRSRGTWLYICSAPILELLDPLAFAYMHAVRPLLPTPHHQHLYLYSPLTLEKSTINRTVC